MAWRLTPADCDTSALEGFVSKTKDKIEYVRGTALLLRAKGRKADEVADELGVCRGAVFKWERIYAKLGIDGLQRKRPTGRPPEKKKQAKKLIPELMKKEPKLF
ncbi:MAG: helix-turn-helix domain-containing protein, partial [Thaumarchaeota archaeon]|nr:helix-turn-helix domain-containing protein [Nitrososphaerota archaeon]